MNKEKVLGQYLAELTQKYNEELEFGSKEKTEEILQKIKRQPPEIQNREMI